jgi:fucose permease
MLSGGMPATLRRRRTALFALFGIPGFAISSWVARTPEIRDLIHASTEQMGLVLFGVSLGSMVGILVSTPLIGRFGTRAVTGVGMVCIVVSMPVVGYGAELGVAAVVAVGLGLFGLGMGGSEIAINSEAADVERAAGVGVLPAMHGCFSLGTVLGAVAGVCCNLTHVPVSAHLVVVGSLGALVLASQVRHLSPQRGGITGGAGQGGAESSRTRMWRDRRLLLIGVIVLTMALAEGAATDWLPLVMVDGHGVSAAAGSMVFAAFSAAMATGRFSGAYFLSRFGRAAVLRFSAMTAAVGIGCIALVDNELVAAASVVLWGLGLSLGFPVAISAAGDSATHSVQRVSFVATMGYVAFLVGPPCLGVIGEDYGLRRALLVPMGLVILASLLAPALAPRAARAPYAMRGD